MFPKELIKIAVDEVAAHAGDEIEEVADAIFQRLDEAGDHDALIQLLAFHAVKGLVYEIRHRSNRSIKAQLKPGSKQRANQVKSIGGRGSRQVARDVYNYYIGKNALGELFGRQLGDIISSEEAIADGHVFNARLLSAIKPLVSKDKRVRQCVSRKRLTSIMQQVSDEFGGLDVAS